MRRSYSEEQKRAAVARVMRGEKPMDVSRSIGVNSNNLIYTWISQYKDTTGPTGENVGSVPKPTKGPKGRLVYPLALKQRAVALVMVSHKTHDEAAAELQIPKDRVVKWVREGVKRGAKGDQARAQAGELIVAPKPAQPVAVAVQSVPRRPKHPSAFGPQDTGHYLQLWERQMLADIRSGKVNGFNATDALVINALVSSKASDE